MNINQGTTASQSMRTCVQCGTDFKVEKGHNYGRYCSGRCSQAAWYAKNRDKSVAKSKAWRERNPDKQARYIKAWRARNQEKVAAEKRRWKSKQSPAWFMWNSAKRRAKVKGLPFTISVDDIVVPDVCPYLNIPLERSVGNGGVAQPNSPSLDRIVGELGYQPFNIRVISHKANTMKQNATEEQLHAFADAIKRLH